MDEALERKLFDMPIPDLEAVIATYYPEFSGVHPACLATPMIDLDGFEGMVEDIKFMGLAKPIIRTKDRLLLDGKVRLLACFLAGVDIHIQDTDIDPWQFVWSANFCRKGMTYVERRQFQHRMANREQEAGT